MPVLSPEQELFADTVTRVAEERIAPIGARMEEDNQFPHDLIDLYRELGWLSLMTPEKYGGGRAGPTGWDHLDRQPSPGGGAPALRVREVGHALPPQVLGFAEAHDHR